MKDTRAKNVASVEDVAKVIRGSKLVQKDMEGAYDSNLDVVVERFEAFIIDLVRCTPRPTWPVAHKTMMAHKTTMAMTITVGSKKSVPNQICINLTRLSTMVKLKIVLLNLPPITFSQLMARKQTAPIL